MATPHVGYLSTFGVCTSAVTFSERKTSPEERIDSEEEVLTRLTNFIIFKQKTELALLAKTL